MTKDAFEFKSNHIRILDTDTKKDSILKVLELLKSDFSEDDIKEISKAIFYRESLMSTGIGLGIGVPHIRTELTHDPTILIGLCRNPLADYESIDSKPVNLIAVIITNRNQHKVHTKILSKIVSIVKKQGVMDALTAADSPDQIHSILENA